MRPYYTNSNVLALDYASRDIELTAIFSLCTIATNDMTLLVRADNFV